MFRYCSRLILVGPNVSCYGQILCMAAVLFVYVRMVSGVELRPRRLRKEVLWREVFGWGLNDYSGGHQRGWRMGKLERMANGTTGKEPGSCCSHGWQWRVWWENLGIEPGSIGKTFFNET